ncbi:MAG: hypothetical protein ACOVQL_09625, partial [Limnohabitans sp.]
MSVINTNVKALYTQNALKVSGREQTTAMQQLSTGKRINSARDDAAGLAIANRMSQQIRSLNMAIRNAGDAVSLIQTAEGATASITDMLQRMRELAVQAINDTNAQDQRGYLDLEFQQLKQQIQSISEFTQWNGFPILNGTAGERVGERPVYKVASSGNFVASDTFEAGIPTTSEALNKVSVSGPGLFTMAGQLRVVPDVSATFTKPDGTIIDLMDPPDDVDVEDWITVVGNEITIKAASGLVDGNVVLTQTVREDDSDADYAGETIILSTKMPTVEAMQANDIIINGITIGAADGLADTVSAGSSVSASAISRAAAINEKTAQTGVVAVVKTTVMTGAQMVGGEPTSGTLTINGYTSARITTTLNNARESRAAVVDAINAISAQTGVVAINTNSDAEGVRLEALDGRNIELSFNTDSDTEDFSAATGLRQGLQIGSYSLESTVEGPVVVTTTSTTDWSRAGIR